MIRLTKRSNEEFLLNHLQIMTVESIPETKIVMMNHEYVLVKETMDEIVLKIAEYNAKVQDIPKEIPVENAR